MVGANLLVKQNVSAAGHLFPSAIGQHCRFDTPPLSTNRVNQSPASLGLVNGAPGIAKRANRNSSHTQVQSGSTTATHCNTSRVLARTCLTGKGRTRFLAIATRKSSRLRAVSAQAQGRRGDPGAVSELSTDIPITYINATDQEDPEFSVVVFQKDANPANARFKETAWKVIKAQSGAEFIYTMQMEVAASYRSGGVLLRQGPFLCELGDTWAIKQQGEETTPLLKLKNKTAASDTLVVQNVKPETFTGRMYDIMLMKDGSPLVKARNVGVNSQVLFQLKPVISFGVIYHVSHGQTFNSFVDSMYNTHFNLLQYAGGGLEVTLNYNKVSGEYTFTGRPKPGT